MKALNKHGVYTDEFNQWFYDLIIYCHKTLNDGGAYVIACQDVWEEFFEDEFSPSEALDEDMSCWDE